jgi:hypothetical protein
MGCSSQREVVYKTIAGKEDMNGRRRVALVYESLEAGPEEG